MRPPKLLRRWENHRVVADFRVDQGKGGIVGGGVIFLIDDPGS